MNRRFYTAAVMASSLVVAPAALANPLESGSQASVEVSEAIAALTEVGVKTVSATTAVPLGSAAAGSTVIGELGEGFEELATGAIEFATSPLTIRDEVVVGPVAQPVPQLPRAPQAN